MDVDKIIVLIPQMLLLFIPGYVALSIQIKYLPKKKPDNFDTTLLSILYSFIVGIAFELMRRLKNCVLPGKVLLGDSSGKYLVFLLLGCVLGFILTKGPNSKAYKKISSMLNNHLDPDTDVWKKAMSHKKGAWATVYLKNGMIYVGELRYFTDDPNCEKKELLLFNYELYIKNESKKTDQDEFSYLIEKSKPNDRVYLQREEILAIQIRPGKDDSESENPNPKETLINQTVDSNNGH